MIIPAKKISAYIDTLSFPLPILEEKGDAVAFEVHRDGLLRLLVAEAVVAIGSWRRIKRVRLNTIDHRVSDIVKLEIEKSRTAGLVAEDSRTVAREGRGYRHQSNRCESYAGQAPKWFVKRFGDKPAAVSA